LLAAKTLMTYLVAHEEEVYPRLAEVGERTRQLMASAFIEEGIPVACTGQGNQELPGSSMFMIHFPYEPDARLDTPEDWMDPSICDLALSHKVLDLALLLEDVFMLHAHGAVSTAHTEADLDLLAKGCRRVARRIKPYM
jgi:glutamate-1-semialdehyde aminotransferase